LQPAIDGLAMGMPVSKQLLELKVLLPLAVLVHGLFKLTWALRQLNYTIALVGAMLPGGHTTQVRNELADAIGGVFSSALVTFNDGIRSYYFALAGLSWLAGPVPLAVTGLALMGLLLHRQLLSRVSGQFRTARLLVEAAHAARSRHDA
jgi:uncharacterized membrane protein